MLTDMLAETPSERDRAQTPTLASPDLLHVEPLPRCDLAQTRLAVALAFAGGVSGGLFDEALDGATLSPTTWEPSCFVDDLFLGAFVAKCFKVRIDGEDFAISGKRTVRWLARPPSDRRVVEHRRGILAELVASPPLRRDVERLYAALTRFRTGLEGALGPGRGDENRRQIDLLQQFKEIVDLAARLEPARSGLRRLYEFGVRVQRGEPYRSLSDLLHYEENLATLSLKVGVGADGRIRGFEITAVEANQKNPFVTSAPRRWLVKLELLLRGFHFGDGEVMAHLIDAVFQGVQDDVVRLVQLLGDLELYLGALGFHDQAKAAGVAVCLPELVERDAPRVLRGLFNPLLVAADVKVVPCDIELDRHDTTVLITGPNSGGKTRLLQSLGLAQLLAQSGLFIPAREGSLALARGMVVSLLQDVRDNQAEGRLGMELLRIRDLFERLLPGTVVILDELCSGTNPSEGEEIFELVVRMLRQLKPQAFITTHFLTFAQRLERERKIEGLRFLQVELGDDQEPTYRFVGGVAKTSLAGQTATRLGVTGEELMKLIERNMRRA